MMDSIWLVGLITVMFLNFATLRMNVEAGRLGSVVFSAIAIALLGVAIGMRIIVMILGI